MTPTDRWLFVGVVVGWTLIVMATGYLMGVQSCGASFGFY